MIPSVQNIVHQTVYGCKVGSTLEKLSRFTGSRGQSQSKYLTLSVQLDSLKAY